MPFGVFSVNVRHVLYGLANSSEITITNKKNLISVKPNSGSQHGGQVIRIDGNGFPKDINELQIKIGTGVCKIQGEYGFDGEVYCSTPAHIPGVKKYCCRNQR